MPPRKYISACDLEKQLRVLGETDLYERTNNLFGGRDITRDKFGILTDKTLQFLRIGYAYIAVRFDGKRKHKRFDAFVDQVKRKAAFHAVKVYVDEKNQCVLVYD